MTAPIASPFVARPDGFASASAVRDPNTADIETEHIPMKISLLPMLSTPEPSPAPVAALYVALLVTACLCAATAALLGSL